MTKRKNNKFWIIGGVLLLAGLIVAAVWKSKSKPKGEKVFVEEVKERDIQEKVSASGKIFPKTEIKITSDVSGEVVELYVEEGDSVTFKQLLAKINPDAYQSQVERGVSLVNAAKAQMANAAAQIETLKAQKEQIEAQLIHAKEIHERNKKLYKDGVLSAADFETSRSNVAALEANVRSSLSSIKAAQHSYDAASYNVKSTEAGLKELRTSLNKTKIYAPATGIVSKLNIEKGERVVGTIQMSGTEMMRIANLQEMEVEVEVSENDIPRVSLGDDVDIEVDAYINRKFKGKVSKIANSASNTGGAAALTTDKVTNFIVTIELLPDSYADLVTKDNPYPFRPGMSATVDINTHEEKNILTVPIQAVATREPEEKEDEATNSKDELIEVVFAVSGDTVRMVQVKTGIQDDNYIQIKSGLTSGEKIVSGPYAAVSKKLKNGKKIHIADKKDLKTKKDKE